jgi:hypothetical protein
VFAALSAASFAAEIVYPATLLRFAVLEADAQFEFALASLTLATWLYHFCQVGASALVPVSSLVALETGVLPRWLALAGFVGAAADALTLPVASCGCFGGAGVDSGGLGPDARRRRWV